LDNPVSILSSIWNRSTGRYVFLPRQVRRNGTVVWEEFEAIDTYAPHLVPYLTSEPQDLYFSALSFTEPHRRMEHVPAGIGLVWLDLDYVEVGMDPITIGSRPNFLWSTSPGHYQAVWFLDRQWSYDEWAPMAKSFTDAQPGADRGGWAATKVLRIPSTVNWKRGGTFAGEVLEQHDREVAFTDLISWKDRSARSIYSAALQGHPQLPTVGEWYELLGRLWLRIPLSAQFNLSPKSKPRTGGNLTRSQLIWEVACTLIRAGFSLEDTFALMWHTPWNKFKDRPRQLWADVQKAAGTIHRITS